MYPCNRGPHHSKIYGKLNVIITVTLARGWIAFFGTRRRCGGRRRHLSCWWRRTHFSDPASMCHQHGVEMTYLGDERFLKGRCAVFPQCTMPFVAQPATHFRTEKITAVRHCGHRSSNMVMVPAFFAMKMPPLKTSN